MDMKDTFSLLALCALHEEPALSQNQLSIDHSVVQQWMIKLFSTHDPTD